MMNRKLTFDGDISNNAPNSSKVMLLYSLLADNKLCSITALSRILEPVEKTKHPFIEMKYK